MYADTYKLSRARMTLDALRKLSGPGSALSRAHQLKTALTYGDATLDGLKLANWEEFYELEKKAALADASELVTQLRSPEPSSTDAVDLYNIIVHHGISLAALGITPEELLGWIENDLRARVASQKD